MRPVKESPAGPPATDKQIELLRRLRVEPRSGLTVEMANREIRKRLKRKAKH